MIMYDELKGVGKEVVMTYLRHNPGISLEWLRKTTKAHWSK